ncbi:hypothetical protein CLV84_3143 [Neolewinella xylanilytica]|uniref:Uncharacterized protein n=1 Tax=Neolewinella xylanilytica TaxID=1514080 RepID=A0A2S6I554_9BACT|nr:hypothetical protein [Neolewinella xylanilytica]PPK86221.1 hypothetical protein CLV84_3143 [Neolewinella xylanilytica]
MAASIKNPGWKTCCVLAVVIMTVAFTPLFLPAGTIEPTVGGMPYTLWSGIALCIVMVILTGIATVVHPGGGAFTQAKEKAS